MWLFSVINSILPPPHSGGGEGAIYSLCLGAKHSPFLQEMRAGLCSPDYKCVRGCQGGPLPPWWILGRSEGKGKETVIERGKKRDDRVYLRQVSGYRHSLGGTGGKSSPQPDV